MAVAGMLVYAGAWKLATVPASSRAIAGLLHLGSQAARRVTVVAAATEVGLALGLVAQVPIAPTCAAVCLTGLLGLHVWTLVARGSGTSCGCYGPKSVVSAASAVRLGMLTGLAWALALAIPHRVDPALMGWSVAVVAVAAFAAAFAVAQELARVVADRSEDDAAPGALEIESEGPASGEVLMLPGDRGGEALSLAVFLSPACGLCRRLQPAIEVFATRPDLELAVYDEERDAKAWQQARVPGSPYAVARDGSGRVLAKGAFNTMRQLESVCATAVRRTEHLEGRDVAAA